MPRHYTTLAEALWSRVLIGPADACWNWQGAKNRGYGQLIHAGKAFRAHRAAYEVSTGPIPPGLFVCHRCDNPSCCNPAHLWLGTSRENTADMWAKGREKIVRGDNHPARLHPETRARGEQHGTRTSPERIPRGEQHGNAKLTTTQVLTIRATYQPGYGARVRMAAAYGVSVATIKRVLSRKQWAHI